MITAVDTNVLIDVVTASPEFGLASRAALSACLTEGNLVVCDVVWTEASAMIGPAREAAAAFNRMGVELSVLVQPSAELAAKAWQAYRRGGGPRTRLAADFLIGGHALFQADRLLTRDRGFYRKYFKDLKVLDPTA